MVSVAALLLEFGCVVVTDDAVGDVDGLIVAVGEAIVVVFGPTLVVDGSTVVGGCATLAGFSAHNWYSARARNLFTFPHVRHLTTTCFSR